MKKSEAFLLEQIGQLLLTKKPTVAQLVKIVGRNTDVFQLGALLERAVLAYNQRFIERAISGQESPLHLRLFQ